MQTYQLNSDLTAFSATAAEATTGQVTLETRKQFIAALNHLTVTLRALRTKTQSADNSTIHNYLSSIAYAALSVFNSTCHTYDHNSDLCQQIVVFLGLLYGSPFPSPFSANASAGLRNVMDAIPHSFFVLASHGRTEDVRPLLNAMFLVANAPLDGKRNSSNVIPLIGWVWKRNSDKSPDSLRFLQILQALFTGWIQAGKSVESWTPVSFLDIAEAITIALNTKFKKTTKEEQHLLVPAVVELVCKIRTTDCDVVANIIPLALCSGVLKALAGLERSDYEYKLSREMLHCISLREEAVQDLAFRKSFDQFADMDSCMLTSAFLIFRVATSISDKLPDGHMRMLRSVIESLLRCSMKAEKSKSKLDSLFHRQLAWCVESYSAMLGNAYAMFLNMSNDEDQLLFLQSLCCENPSNRVAIRFALAAAVKCSVTPQFALHFLDTLSFVQSQSTAPFEIVSKKLVPSICNDAATLRKLLELVMSQLTSVMSRNAKERLFFQMRSVSVALITLRASANNLDQNKLQAGIAGEFDVWSRFATLVQQTILTRAKEEAYSSTCIQCLQQLLQTEIKTLGACRSRLATDLPSQLIEHYLFSGTKALQSRRLLHTASVFDAIAQASLPENVIEESMTNIIDIAKTLPREREKPILLLLLRFMGRCKLQSLPTILTSISKLLANNEALKSRALPLIRVAILGADLSRKNTCVLWLLQTFGSMPKQILSSPSSPITSKL